MWWEYIIIFAGLIAAAGYVLWTFLRSFRVKGNCCSGGGCAPKSPDGESRRVRVTPLVDLRSPARDE